MEERSRAPWIALAGILSLYSFALVARPTLAGAAPFVLAVAVGTLAWRVFLRWEGLLGALIIVVLFVPFRQYELPSALPFNLDPYRLLVAFIAVGWSASLLVDPRVRLRASPLLAPLLAFAGVCALSIVVNSRRVQELGVGGDAIKQLTFLLSFIVVFVLFVSLLTTRRQLDTALSLLVGGMAVVAALSLVEYRTGFNVFAHLDRIIPGLVKTDQLTRQDVERLGQLRVYGSAQHPIALGAAFVLLLPFTIYLARRRRAWLWAGALLFLGAMATLSRTAVVMIAVTVLVFAMLRTAWLVGVVKRFWPWLIPAVIAFHFVLPGTIGTFKDLFFPQGGLVAEQSKGTVGSNRGASFHAGLKIVDGNAALGIGYGTRIVEGPGQNSFITDDQWVASAMEIGLVGTAVLSWLFLRSFWVFQSAAARDQTDLGFFFTAVAAAPLSFAVGMIFYDALSFIQVTVLLIMLLALGSAALGLDKRESSSMSLPHASE